jgi:hypothetical protein
MVQLRPDLEASVLEAAPLRQKKCLELQAAERRQSDNGADSNKFGGGARPAVQKPVGDLDEERYDSPYFSDFKKTRGKKCPSPSTLGVNPETPAKYFLGDERHAIPPSSSRGRKSCLTCRDTSATTVTVDQIDSQIFSPNISHQNLKFVAVSPSLGWQGHR